MLSIFFFFTAPKAKRQKQEAGVAKRLFDCQRSKAPNPSYDITPPSSPEQYEASHTVRYERCVIEPELTEKLLMSTCSTVSFTGIKKIFLYDLIDLMIKVVIFFVFWF